MSVDRVGFDDSYSPDNIGETINALRRHCKLTVKGLADLSGIKRPTLHTRLIGGDHSTAQELSRLAYVFNVPIPVLFLPPDFAIRWVLDHPGPRPRGGNAFSRCIGSAVAA